MDLGVFQPSESRLFPHPSIENYVNSLAAIDHTEQFHSFRASLLQLNFFWNILGADIFRLNFSHGEHQQKADLVKIIRDIEKKYDHPIAILADLQVYKWHAEHSLTSLVTS